ncbi:hypothetical protein NQ314_016616 [Rhamnusium bicolor]|uniref:Uncharacterized protein n=1 Tax=Rhamnusium bicolor TaxID=1586634 RepID=A0AAV8WVF4_9CUCU|nr:hypothetical protein NQ314_016616 [Rhamnusium bicolor]
MSAKLLLLLGLVCQAWAICPTKCTCYLDQKGRISVLCKEGGMVGPLNLNNVSLETEVIKITAPEDNTNVLTMSPVFQSYKNLEEIHNNITQPLDHNFRGLSKLKELYLDDNRIMSLPSGTFRFLPELKVLSIQRNRIEELTPRIFLEISKLKVLKLSGNNLKELNPEVFKDVQLDGNQITTVVDSTFIHQLMLKKLNLARNQIQRITPNAFENLNNLTELDVSYNKLEKLGFFEPVSDTLEILSLSGNHIKMHTLKELLHLENLRELHLVECGIADIPYEIFPLTLSILDLGGNHLSSLKRELLPSNLIELDISKNRYRGLDENVLTLLDNVPKLKLENNLWSCDLCHIVPLLERVNRSGIFREIVCISPFTVKGKKLEMIRKNELTWCTSPSYTASDANFFLIGEDGKVGIIAAGTSICLLLLTVLAIIGALCYSKRHAAKYYTHEDKLAMEGESIFDNNHSPLFCDGELSFKFPLDAGEKKMSISTIDEIKKEHTITNGT